jgi:hypothetical protein
MEKPVVIVIVGFEMDNTTLACALGRATTQARIVVPVELLIGLSDVKSDFMRSALQEIDPTKVLNQDAGASSPRFIANKLQKYAGTIGEHSILGEGFAYASRWRRWIYEGGPRWANRSVQLWGWWLSLSTSLPISGLDPVRNEPTDCRLQHCAECDNITPHDGLRKCLTCLAPPLSEASVSEIVRHAATFGKVHSGLPWQSLINVAVLVANFQFPRSNEGVRGIVEVPALFLATTIVEFRMRNEAPVAQKSQMEQWLREVLLVEELDDSIEDLTGRTIGSLCAQKLLKKTDIGRYRLE